LFGLELRTLLLLGHAPNPFCFSYFSDSVLHFCLGLASVLNPPAYSSNIAGMTGVFHYAQLVG
jgi:hypothetical protein